jgi:hypothetical protein
VSETVRVLIRPHVLGDVAYTAVADAVVAATQASSSSYDNETRMLTLAGNAQAILARLRAMKKPYSEAFEVLSDKRAFAEGRRRLVDLPVRSLLGVALDGDAGRLFRLRPGVGVEVRRVPPRGRGAGVARALGERGAVETAPVAMSAPDATPPTPHTGAPCLGLLDPSLRAVTHALTRGLFRPPPTLSAGWEAARGKCSAAQQIDRHDQERNGVGLPQARLDCPVE